MSQKGRVATHFTVIQSTTLRPV